MPVFNVTGYGDLSVNAPANSNVVVIGDVRPAFSGVLRSDVRGTVKIWGPWSATLPIASVASLETVLRAGMATPFNVSGDLIGATVSVLCTSIGDSQDSTSATHRTLTFTLRQVTPS